MQRTSKDIKVLTIGTFDIPHAGHAAFLRQCEQFGNVVVGVNTDGFVEAYKGIKPIFNEADRLHLIEKMGYTSVLNYSDGRELIVKEEPDIIAIGSDWARKDYLEQIDVTQDWLDEHDISLIYIPYTQGISTTEIKERIS